jgi:hypothetical protein
MNGHQWSLATAEPHGQVWLGRWSDAYPQLVEPGLPTTFNRNQKFVEAPSLLVADIVDEKLPQTRLHARTDLGNKPFQYLHLAVEDPTEINA